MKFSLNWLNRYTSLPMEDKVKLEEIINKIAYQIVDVDERWIKAKDAIIDVDNKIITNRPYCFGHRGLAREVAIMLDQKYSGSEYPVLPNSNTNNLKLIVTVEDPSLCPRFTSITIENVKVGPSPEFLKYAVESVGLRSINNIVDITNMIMLDTGQPVHAYDYDKVKNGQIIVRRAKEGEKVITLDGVERSLTEEVLLITDPEKVIGIAGVMGAGNSEIDDNTTNIILEIASFHPINIRQTARFLRHRTDAVQRFEKGPDAQNIPNVMAFMVDLILNVCGGQIASDFVDISNLDKSILRTTPLIMDFNPKRVDKLLGFGIEESFIEKVLNGFDIRIEKQSPDNWRLEIPTFRSDIREPADLVEDIGRMYGYQNIPNITPVNRLIIPKRNVKVDLLRKARNVLTASGFDETITFSFISDRDRALFNLHDSIRIINPLSEEYTYLRKSLIPSLTKVVAQNAKHLDSFGLFEISRKFLKNNSEAKSYLVDKGESMQPYEVECVSMVYYHKQEKEKSIFRLKGALENLLDQLKINSFVIEDNGSILLSGKEIGRIGLLNNSMLENYNIEYPVSFLEIDLKPLIENYNDTIAYNEFSKFQGTRLDYSVLVSLDLPVSEIINIIPESELITNKEIIDVYKDLKDFPDKKSVTVRIYLQKQNGNLTDTEIYELGLKIEESIKSILEAQIRGGGVSKPANYKPQNLNEKESNMENNKIVIGKIIEITKHPNADKLVITKVDVGSSKPEGTLFDDYLQVVTGAKNIGVGDIIPVALPGAQIPGLKDEAGNPVIIKKGNLRGERSEGMMCSKREMGVSDEYEGIWLLDGELYKDKIGQIFTY